MNDEIELFQDDKGLAVIGSSTAIDTFLSSHGLTGTDMQLSRLTPFFKTSAGVGHAASQMAEQSGRWVKITAESAKAIKRGKLMKGSTGGVSRAVVMKDGKISNLVEIVSRPGTFLTNPAILSGLAGIMSQMAMQQAMDDINKYLATIDTKIEKVLQNQKDSLLSGLIGLNLQIEEALTVRKETGQVSDITWSKIQNGSTTLAQAQAYSLRQLETLCDDLAQPRKLHSMAKWLEKIEPQLAEWLAILAYCFQLQDGISIIELDRVLATSPNQVESHRRALQLSRHQRLELTVQHTDRIHKRLTEAQRLAQDKTLIHPSRSREVVEGGNRVTRLIASFHDLFELSGEFETTQAKGWWRAASELRDDIVNGGKNRLETAREIGGDALTIAQTIGSVVVDEVTRMRQIKASSDESESEHEGVRDVSTKDETATKQYPSK